MHPLIENCNLHLGMVFAGFHLQQEMMELALTEARFQPGSQCPLRVEGPNDSRFGGIYVWISLYNRDKNSGFLLENGISNFNA